MLFSDEQMRGLRKCHVLALDIAERCGYFYNRDVRGTWDLRESVKRNDNKQHKAFRDTLMEFVRTHGIRQIVAEDVNVDKSFGAVRKLSEFRGVLLEVCDELGLPEPKFVNVKTIKKWFTGSGSADKKKMIDTMIEHYGLTPIDDNEADAFAIHLYYCRLYHLSE